MLAVDRIIYQFVEIYTTRKIFPNDKERRDRCSFLLETAADEQRFASERSMDDLREKSGFRG